MTTDETTFPTGSRRPAVNALSLALLEQLVAALRRAAADENVRAVVLTSALPRRFSARLDLGMMLGKSATHCPDRKGW